MLFLPLAHPSISSVFLPVWCVFSLFVRDLEYINVILQILHERLFDHLPLFEETALEVLQTCAKVSTCSINDM